MASPSDSIARKLPLCYAPGTHWWTHVNEAFVNPKVIRWARERKAAPLEEIARALKVKAPQIAAWEAGSSRPPFAKAQALAKTLHIPFGYLFLSDPPDHSVPIPDLRTAGGSPRGGPSLDFLDLLNEVMVKQDWYREHVRDRGPDPPGFVGKFSPKSHSPSDVATDIRRSMSINSEVRRRSKSWDEYLRKLSESAESAGILVMRSGVVGCNTRRPLSVEEFRGFAITDNLAPLVFINGKDAKAAQIFTLLHEIAHIWIGQSGISNPDPLGHFSRHPIAIEEFCNAVAAEALVPNADFLNSWDRSTHDRYRSAEKAAREYRVSVPVILRRARELRAIAEVEYFGLVREHKRKLEELEANNRGEQQGGGNFYNNLWVRNSKKLTEAILAATRAKSLTMLDAARVLGVGLPIIPKLLGRGDV